MWTVQRPASIERQRTPRSARIKVPVAVLMIAVCGAGGYFIGRDVIAERYLKPGASALAPFSSGAPSQPGENSPQGVRLLGSDPFVYVERRTGTARTPGAKGAGRAAGIRGGAAKPRRYTVQVGVFLDKEKSRLLQEELNNRGYSARLREVQDQGRMMHRVEAGSFADEQEARRMQEELSYQGYRVIVVPEQ
jgi:hypothetical protein